MLHGDHAGAETAVSLALQEYPRSFELLRFLAGIYSLTRREREAETLLSRLFTERREDAATAFTLARLLISRCRSAAATYAEQMRQDDSQAARGSSTSSRSTFVALT